MASGYPFLFLCRSLIRCDKGRVPSTQSGEGQTSVRTRLHDGHSPAPSAAASSLRVHELSDFFLILFPDRLSPNRTPGGVPTS